MLFDIYKICIFIGMHCFMFGFGIFEACRKLKSEGAISGNFVSLRNSSYILLGSSAILLFIGFMLYQYV